MAHLPYTVGTLIDDALIYLKTIVMNSTLGRKEIRILLKEAFQNAYDEALMAEPTFFFKSNVFTANTFVTNPSHHRSTVAVRITSSSCRTKGATAYPLDEWQLMLVNGAIAPTADDPAYQLKATGFELQPSLAGIQYYVRTVNEATLDDDSQDVYAIMPWVMIPMVLLKVVELARIRHFPTEEIPSNLVNSMQRAMEANKTLTRFLDPEVQNFIEGQAPTTITAGRSR